MPINKEDIKVGDYITKLTNDRVDKLLITLPAKVVAKEGNYSLLVEHPDGHGSEFYSWRGEGRPEPNKRYWNIHPSLVVEAQSKEEVEGDDKMTGREIVESNSTYFGLNPNGYEVFETNKIRKIRSALKRHGYLYGWSKNFVLNDQWTANVDGMGTIIIRKPVAEEEEPEEDKMDKIDKDNDEKSFKNQVKGDLEKVAYRQGARKITGISHAVFLHLLRRQGFDDTKLAVVLEALETDIGRALLSYGLGKAAERVKPDHEIAQKLAEEFRVSGMDLGVEAGLDKVAAKGLELMPAGVALLSAIEKTARDGITLESVQEFAKVDAQLPQELLQELSRMDNIKTRIEAVPEPAPVKAAPIEDFASELETQSEEEVEEPAPLAKKFASCS